MITPTCSTLIWCFLAIQHPPRPATTTSTSVEAKGAGLGHVAEPGKSSRRNRNQRKNKASKKASAAEKGKAPLGPVSFRKPSFPCNEHDFESTYGHFFQHSIEKPKSRFAEAENGEITLSAKSKVAANVKYALRKMGEIVGYCIHNYLDLKKTPVKLRTSCFHGRRFSSDCVDIPNSPKIVQIDSCCLNSRSSRRATHSLIDHSDELGSYPQSNVTRECWQPWGRLVAWGETGPRDSVCLRLYIIPEGQDVGILVSEITLSAEKEGECLIDMDRQMPGDGKSSRPVVQLAVRHVTCVEDVVMFMALATTVDLSMEACSPFRRKARKGSWHSIL
ncbi:hypothetical protein KSP39_PZI014395 [Platanthera zijinensis]|uniref:Uncharacterized protein n=1 Tax=Platanthera zijinensis TaxID=2320716 RepID=A0AAP0BAB4_9ASPA